MALSMRRLEQAHLPRFGSKSAPLGAGAFPEGWLEVRAAWGRRICRGRALSTRPLGPAHLLRFGSESAPLGAGAFADVWLQVRAAWSRRMRRGLVLSPRRLEPAHWPRFRSTSPFACETQGFRSLGRHSCVKTQAFRSLGPPGYASIDDPRKWFRVLSISVQI